MAGGMHGRVCVIVLLDYCIVLLVFNMHGRGHAWLGACVAGGVHGRVCVIVLLDCCIVLLMFNMHGRGHAWLGGAWLGTCDCIIGLLYCATSV